MKSVLSAYRNSDGGCDTKYSTKDATADPLERTPRGGGSRRGPGAGDADGGGYTSGGVRSEEGGGRGLEPLTKSWIQKLHVTFNRKKIFQNILIKLKYGR